VIEETVRCDVFIITDGLDMVVSLLYCTCDEEIVRRDVCVIIISDDDDEDE
jgi:VIT1/CCC1 family predicted Fe2+/Mn2+ transporter